jgi:hypothetical protein
MTVRCSLFLALLILVSSSCSRGERRSGPGADPVGDSSWPCIEAMSVVSGTMLAPEARNRLKQVLSSDDFDKDDSVVAYLRKVSAIVYDDGIDISAVYDVRC